MKARIVLVTGATDGIGREMARTLAMMGYYVLLHGRDRERGEAVQKDIIEATGRRNCEFYCADFSSLPAVRRMAEEIRERHDRLNILVNNAGVFMQVRELTEDGMEMTFGVNHLAPFLLTSLMLDSLIRSAPSRIVTVSSISHWPARVDWNNLQGERRFSGHDAYSLSKLANILFTYELADRLKGTGVTATTLDPGNIDTKMLRAGWPSLRGDSPAAGARTPLYLATAPEVEGITGVYFEACAPASSSPMSMDRGLRKQFWRVSEKLAGLC